MTSSTTPGTTTRRRRRAATTGWRRTAAAAVALLLPALALPLVTAPAAAAAVPVVTAAAALPAPITYTSGTYPDAPPCPTGRYVVPAGVRFVQVAATAGGGAAGHSLTGSAFGLEYTVHDGGLAGTGAAVTATIPVTPGQTLTVVTGRDGSNNHADAYSGWPNGGENSFQEGGGGGSSYVTTQPLVASTGCKDIASSRLDRTKVLVMAGGGGGGGSANVTGAGGYGGSAGVNGSLNGENGRDAYHLDSDCGQGRGGAGASTTGPGAGGATTCLSTTTGSGGQGFNGGEYLSTTINALAGAGAGGGGWYGGGGGSNGNGLGGGGGGAGSSYVTPAARSYTVTQAKTRPAVTVTPVAAPTTTLSLNGSAPVERYAGSATVTLAADAGGGAPVDRIFYSIDNSSCSFATSGCAVYAGPVRVGPGLHTITWFTLNTERLDDVQQTHTFYVAPDGSTPVTASAVASGTNPAATAGGRPGAPGTVSVAATAESGAVGAAIDAANPAGATTFDSTGAFAEVSASKLVADTITVVDCDLRGGTLLYYWTGDSWNLVTTQDPSVAAQTYDPSTQCATATLTVVSRPSFRQLRGPSVFLAAGRAPTAAFTSTPPTLPALGASYTPTATATNGLPVTFAVTGPCTLTDGTVTFTGAGTCTVTATQAGNAGVPAAVLSTQTITIPQATQTISFTSTAPTTAVTGGTYTPAATGGASGQPVTFGAAGTCTTTGTTVRFTGAGTCTITADQTGNADYTAAPRASRTITVGRAAQSIAVTSTPPSAPVVGGTYTPTATGGASRQPVTFGVTGPCTLVSGTVTFAGAGTCTVTADQAGNADYTAAPRVTQVLTVGASSTRTSYPLTGTATVTGKTPVPFRSTPLTATLTATLSSTGTTTVGTGFTDGQLVSTSTTFRGTALGFLPATITAHLESTAPVTGTTGTTTSLTTSVRLVVDQISVFGAKLVLPGSTCATTTPSSVTLTGAPGVLTTGGDLSGTYTASRFSGCGLLGPVLTPQLNQLAGIPQAVTVTLGKPAATSGGTR